MGKRARVTKPIEIDLSEEPAEKGASKPTPGKSKRFRSLLSKVMDKKKAKDAEKKAKDAQNGTNSERQSPSHTENKPPSKEPLEKNSERADIATPTVNPPLDDEQKKPESPDVEDT